MEQKIMVAMSGGVDSSVAARLLLEEGYQCVGASMALCHNECRDAQAVAEGMGLPFLAFDAREEFARQVMDAFVRVYEEGGTPNPCMVCNNTMKFGYLLDRALEAGCTHLATGHYARICPSGDRFLLCKGACEEKDQS